MTPGMMGNPLTHETLMPSDRHQTLNADLEYLPHNATPRRLYRALLLALLVTLWFVLPAVVYHSPRRTGGGPIT